MRLVLRRSEARVSSRMTGDRHSTKAPRSAASSTALGRRFGVRKALISTELSRTALGMLGAQFVYLFDHHVHQLVVRGFGLGADVAHRSLSLADFAPGLRTIDRRDRLEQHPTLGHFEVEVVALLELE